ncbi:MAG: cbb3-type cytochrome c oxidase N-terminal domain-containing protein [Bacteroidia bacterium]
MAKNRDDLTNHDYDGIQEYDNDLPPWWIFIFYLSFVFALIYLLNYHVFRTAPLQSQEYAMEMEMARAELAAIEASASARLPLAFMDKVTDLETGKQIFTKYCVPCHGPDGGGTVGPNLTDHYFLHGNTVEDYFNVISLGVPEKGMIPWNKTLSRREILQVASYIQNRLQGSIPANPKEPQGTPLDQRISMLWGN